MQFMDKNTRTQGARAVARAIAHYTEKGWPVFVPVIGDTTRYDLIVDYEHPYGLQRVEVKSTNRENGEVNLRTKGGNRSGGTTVKRLSADDCDIVFCVNLYSGGVKEFSIKHLEGRSTVRIF